MTRLPGRSTESQATSPATRALGRPETTPRLVTTELRTTTGAFKSLRKPNQPAQLESGATAVNSNVRIPTSQTFTKRNTIRLHFLLGEPGCVSPGTRLQGEHKSLLINEIRLS